MLTDSTQNRADGVQKRAYIFTITRSSYALIIIGRKKHYSAWNVGNNKVGGVYYHSVEKKFELQNQLSTVIMPLNAFNGKGCRLKTKPMQEDFSLGVPGFKYKLYLLLIS